MKQENTGSDLELATDTEKTILCVQHNLNIQKVNWNPLLVTKKCLSVCKIFAHFCPPLSPGQNAVIQGSMLVIDDSLSVFVWLFMVPGWLACWQLTTWTWWSRRWLTSWPKLITLTWSTRWILWFFNDSDTASLFALLAWKCQSSLWRSSKSPCAFPWNKWGWGSL